MAWSYQLNADPLPWLLEPHEPGVRYLALRQLLHYPPSHPEMRSACQAAHQQGPIAAILQQMDKEGYWVQPGPGYNPKYRATVWSLILLAQLGASIEYDERIARACSYFFDHGFADSGQFSMTGAPSGTVDCMHGNMCWALLTLGSDDPRLESAFEWMARTVTGEGLAPKQDKKAQFRYYAAKCGPLFACGFNYELPCAWGAARVMLAFSVLPTERRTPLIQQAIEQGVEFLFSVDPASAAYPSGGTGKPSGNWWKFGFPLFYITDILQIVEVLVALGYGQDPRLTNALALVQEKQDEQGRWLLEYDYAGKTWGDFGEKKKPNKWVTLRAVRTLQAAAA